MKSGALVMMDALGLRARWANRDPALILRKLHFLKSDAESYHALQIAGQTGADNVIASASVQFLSDTIVLTVTMKDPDAHRAMAVIFAAAYASRLMQLSLETAVPFAYRGCVAFGDFSTLDNFVVGRAAYAEAADGAFVWLLPSALEAMRGEPAHGGKDDTRLIRHSVPLKGGTMFSSLIATPFFGITKGFQPDALRGRMLETFDGNSVAVQAKRQYTEPFLDEAVRRLEKFREHSQPSVWNVGRIGIPSDLDDWSRVSTEKRS